MSAPETPRVGDFFWHIHHDVLCELLTEPVKNRIAFIKENKPMGEVETRLRLMKPVRNVRALLGSDTVAKVFADMSKADDANWGKRYIDWSEAYAEWLKSCPEKIIMALHAEECPNCPWNGRTIFS